MAGKEGDQLTLDRSFCFSFQLPAVAEFSTGETMGHSGDRYRTDFMLCGKEKIILIVLLQ